MKLKKPKFWDYKKPNIFAYLLLPLTFFVILIGFFYKKEKIKSEKIKTLCVGNIYLGGTGKTPISIKLNEILKKLNFKTSFIKKKYSDQIDEQKILALNGNLFCKKNRIDALNEAINHNTDIAIFDDGLQDKKLIYDISFVCFNIKSWIGNGLCIPSGPLRESLNSLKKYDAVFLNGNEENVIEIENIIRNIKPNIEIFKSYYSPLNIEEIDLNQNYLVFSGIGNPKTFIETLKKNNFKIAKSINFPDHYEYTNKDITKIKDLAKKLKAKIITTEKDYNRLSKLDSEGIIYLSIELKIINENQLVNFLKKKL